MLDAKVLAAVFASLTAVATTMNGGSFQPDMAVNGVSAGNIDIPDFADGGGSDSIINQLQRIFDSRPEPKNNIRATLEISDFEDERASLDNSTVFVSDLRKVNLGSRKVSSDQKIIFNDLSGEFKLDDPTVLKGKAKSLSSSGVKISGNINVNQEINSSRIEIEEKGRAKISFSDVEADIRYEDKSEQTLNAENFKIDSFNGRKVIYPSNSTVILDGKINSLNAGEFSYGG